MYRIELSSFLNGWYLGDWHIAFNAPAFIDFSLGKKGFSIVIYIHEFFIYKNRIYFYPKTLKGECLFWLVGEAFFANQ